MERQTNQRHALDNYNEIEELNYASDFFLFRNPFHSFGSSSNDSDLQEYLQRGRRSNLVNSLREDGKQIRDALCKELENQGMARPLGYKNVRRDRHYRAIEN